MNQQISNLIEALRKLSKNIEERHELVRRQAALYQLQYNLGFIDKPEYTNKLLIVEKKANQVQDDREQLGHMLMQIESKINQ